MMSDIAVRWFGDARKILVFVLALGLQGCSGGDMTDLRTFVETAHKDKKPDIEPLPEIPPFKAFEYEGEGGVDPFSTSNIGSRDIGVNGENAGRRPDSERRRQPLESYPLDSLRMVGTIARESVAHVVVKTSEGAAVLAGVGEYMGQNDGKIMAIIPEEQRVVLVETVLDPSGRWVTRDVEITINE